jgi:hypothetical protein
MAARPASNAAPSTRGPATSRLGAGEARQGQQVFEVSGKLKRSGQVTLDASGNGTIQFVPYNARQRWEVDQIVVSTNQSATSTPVPVASAYVNATTSAGNLEGSTSSGNQDTMLGLVAVGPVDNLNITWTGGISGSVATAIITGTFYTRRA